MSLGLKRGDRVLMFLDDTPAYPAAFFGAVRAGFVPLLINTLTPPDLLQFYLSDSGATVAVADAEFCARFDAVACKDTALAHADRRSTATAGDHAVPNAIVADPGCRAFRPIWPRPTPIATKWRSGCIRRARPDGPRASSICSTTWPIATTRSRRNVLKLTPDDICFSVPKIFFAYGFGNSITFPFSAGAATLLLPGQPKPAAIFEAIERFRPTRVLRIADALYVADQGRRRCSDGFFLAANGVVRRRGAVGGGLPRLENPDRT